MNDEWMPAFAKPADNRAKPQEIEIGPNGLSIDLLRAIYRSSSLPLATRMRAAIAALPHEVPKLIATAVVSEGSFADLLDRRLKRIDQMKEEKPVNGNQVTDSLTTTSEVEVKAPSPSPLARLYSPRFRRF
jgi:hypothetical protein